jgi:hypothetical protein
MTMREPISYAACDVMRTELRRALVLDVSVLRTREVSFGEGKAKCKKAHVSLSTLMMALPAELV